MTPQWKGLTRLGRLVTRARWEFWALPATKLVGILLNLPLPMLTMSIIDNAIVKQNWSAYKLIVGKFAALMIASFLFALFVSFMVVRLDALVSFRLRRMIYSKWGKARLSAIGKADSGEHLYQITGEVESFKSGVMKVGSGVILSSVELFVYLGAVLWLYWKAGVLCSFILPVLVWANLRYNRRIRELQSKMQSLSGRITTAVNQFLGGIVTVKVFSAERLMCRKYVHLLSEMVRLTLARWRVESAGQTVRWVLTTGWNWVIFLYCAKQVMKGELTLGQLIALRIYYGYLEKPINEIVDIIQTANTASVAGNHIIDTLALPEEGHTGMIGAGRASLYASMFRNNGNRMGSPARITFKDVCFSYREGKPILSDVNFAVPAGSVVGIGGRSGEGKTTLISLLARLYEPDSGSIYIDGEDITGFSIDQVRAWLSICPQDTYLFSGTIAENIAYGSTHVDREEIEEAARLSGAHDFICKLENQYEERIAGVGSRLSVGQKQRLGLARAFLKPSRILILDEGLRGLDPVSSNIVVHAIRELACAKTVLVVSHEDFLLNHCDIVLRLEHTRITTELNPNWRSSRHGCANGGLGRVPAWEEPSISRLTM